MNKGNKEVTVVEMTKKVGKDIGLTTRWTVMGELRRLGINILTNTKAVGIKADGLEVEKEDGPDFLHANSIIIAAGSRPENSLVSEIESLVPEIYTVGDAKEPRNALDAIKEGFLVALKI